MSYTITASADEEGPKNVIYMIGDGMGYNQVDMVNLAEDGLTYYQVETLEDDTVVSYEGNSALPTSGFQSWDLVGMSTWWAGGTIYDGEDNWGDFGWAQQNYTDSAAAGTAMATGVKTYNEGIGVDVDRQPVENLSQRAKEIGKSAGVVTDVPYSHATPGSFSAHNVHRNNYREISNQQLHDGVMDVVIGAGHPYYNNDNEHLGDDPVYTYIDEDDWALLTSGESDFTFIETNEEFEALVSGDTPDKVWGVPQVASTLQQSRAEDFDDSDPRPDFNDVPSLATLSLGALNVLDNNDEGFVLMIEGGAIDWASHANQTRQTLEETQFFIEAIEAVAGWVEENSSWDETLVVITADHETGHLTGPEEGVYSPMSFNDDESGEDYQALELSWNSPNHTNILVPFWMRGSGTDVLLERSTGEDHILGAYLDNTTLARWLLNEVWVAGDGEPTPEPTEEPTPDPSEEPTTDPEPTKDPKKPKKPKKPSKPGLPSTGV